MQINPEKGEFSGPIDLGNDMLEREENLKKLTKHGNVVAIGPAQHLQALRLDLIRAGYRRQK